MMTVTFNTSLLNILGKMIGIKVLRGNYLWSERVKMERRHIRINVNFTLQTNRHIKYVLENTLSDNLDKKSHCLHKYYKCP